MNNQTSPLTVSQCALRLGVNERTVRRMIDRGDLKAYRVASLIRITEEDFNAAWLPVRGGAFD